MKQNFFMPVGVVSLMLAFVACTDEISEAQSFELKQIVFTATDFEDEIGSRTNFKISSAGAEFSWAANDTVGIFPNEGAQAYFPMISGAGTKSANFTGGGWALKDASTYAAYYPFIGNFYLDKNAIPLDYTGQVQTGDASTVHLGAYDFMVAVPTAPKNGNVNFAFKHLGALVQLKLTIPQTTTLTSVTLTTESNDISEKGTIDIMASSLSINPVSSTNKITLEIKDIATTEANQEVTLYMMIPPVNLTNRTLKAIVKTSIGSEEVALSSKNFQAGKAYAFNAFLDGKTNFERTVKTEKAGNMKQLLGTDYLKITSLKVVGPINGDDIYYLRKMLGGEGFSESDWGKLTSLDLSEATIVNGGGWYYLERTYSYSEPEYYYTSNNIIGKKMFSNCKNLQNIILPENINVIEGQAFTSSPLTTISIPKNVTKIGISAFRYCSHLVSVNLNENLTIIEPYAFWLCKALISIEIPSNVISIGDEAFRYCESLTSATIHNGVIGDHAFGSCDNLRNIVIGDAVTSIGTSAFYGASVTSLFIPKAKIGKNAFRNCKALSSLTTVNCSIGEYSFENCTALESINIGTSEIGKYAFNNCTALTSATIKGAGWSNLRDYAFNNCKALSFVALEGIRVIWDYAFDGCISLTTLVLGKELTSIKEFAFDDAPINKCYCYAEAPPSLDSSSFWHLKQSPKEAILYVPSRQGVNYNSTNWGKYFTIIEMD